MGKAAIAMAVAAVCLGLGGRANALGTCGSGGVVGRNVKVTFDPSEYYVWAPPIDPMKPVPLVVVLHGDEGSPTKSQTYFWDPLWAKTQDFIAVLPRAPYA